MAGRVSGRSAVRAWRRIARDLLHRRHVEVYLVAAASVVLAALSLAGDVVNEDVRWATVFAALGLLTYQLALPDRASDLDDVLHNRAAFDDITFSSRIRGAREVWVLAPSAVNLLTASTADDVRKSVLGRGDGVFRVMVLDPAAGDAVVLAAHQLDDATDYPAEALPDAVQATAARLEMMASWDVVGEFQHRYVGFNPGFSIVAIDPNGRDGLLIVEFHGVHNESAAARMHVQLTRTSSEHWYVYWRDQFEHLWQGARVPGGARAGDEGGIREGSPANPR
jgi:hypothetical protein